VTHLWYGVLLLWAVSLPASALSLSLPTPLGTYTTDVVSFKEQKFQAVIRQQYDFSCGSAAVASLLTYHYDDPRTEQEVFQTMWANGDQALIKQQGFSLLDMKRYLEHHGYRADGFRLSLDRLRKVGVPAITLINNNGYMHFVVVKGIADEEILLGDPTLGVRRMPRDKFEEQWQNGIVFLVKNKAQLARASFNREEAWNTVARAPIGYGKSISSGSLANFNLLLPARSDF
jgi:predicted double-glycine peptidase